MNLPKIAAPPTASARALLADIVDYAGLFPPSQLSMVKAVANYAEYKTSADSWMLGRFVVPVARLDEFIEAADRYIAHDTNQGWRLSVLASEDVNETLKQIDRFNSEHASRALCDALEVKANSASKIENTANALPDYLTAYFELPLDNSLEELIFALAMFDQRAKIRTGGVTVKDFPSTADITRFLLLCRRAEVPFKATAGLHHPLRCFKPLTYQPNAPQGTMHGFLNLFLATGFARLGFKEEKLEELLEDEFSEGFVFNDGGVIWHRDYILTTPQLKKMRENGIISFGSCSFDEPVADLQKLKIL